MKSKTENDAAPFVLYVDDYPVNVQLMQALFDLRTAFQLRHAESAREALALRFSTKPALLLLDLNLPDVHGSQLLGLLRRQHDWKSVPAVAVTADHEFDALGAGFDELWEKPLDLRHVLQRLQFLTDPGWRVAAVEFPQRPPAPRPQPRPDIRSRGAGPG